MGWELSVGRRDFELGDSRTLDENEEFGAALEPREEKATRLREEKWAELDKKIEARLEAERKAKEPPTPEAPTSFVGKAKDEEWYAGIQHVDWDDEGNCASKGSDGTPLRSTFTEEESALMAELAKFNPPVAFG